MAIRGIACFTQDTTGDAIYLKERHERETPCMVSACKAVGSFMAFSTCGKECRRDRNIVKIAYDNRETADEVVNTGRGI